MSIAPHDKLPDMQMQHLESRFFGLLDWMESVESLAQSKMTWPIGLRGSNRRSMDWLQN